MHRSTGDTLVLNGITYTNVIKTKDLAERLKKIGMPVSMDFKVISANKVETTGLHYGKPCHLQSKRATHY
ncbi:MAG: hypothetical protein WKG06_05010 [Segetibacter sp.]